MGISQSSRRRNTNQQNPPPYYYSHQETQPSYPPPSLPHPPPPPPPQNPYPPSYQPHMPPFTDFRRYNYNYSNPQYPPYYGWGPARPPMVGLLPPPPPLPHVEHQNAKKVVNNVNVHKDTLRLEVDEANPDHHLVSFVFDALSDGSFTIFYFGKEETNCRFVPQFPDTYLPVKIPFVKGPGQKFRQPSGTGIDLGFFEWDDLTKPYPGDVFPLVISAESYSSGHLDNQPVADDLVHMQVTQAVLEKNNDGSLRVKVIRQILWVDGVRYELREIYGIGNSASAEGFDDSDPGKECVICLTEQKDTAILPCRHMCMCSECAKELVLQTNKCPICRQPIEEIIGINVNKINT